ncbi:glucosamine inositolphosphorylceramide transferase family protein [Clostridium perfringens]|uniref:glucosamine inositolphosphorylceramide transferase family protein n=1 Tax=Clostridium perfringens TaxID=1502 RepID=UPI0037548D93
MSNKNKEIVMPTWRDKQTPVNAANLNSMVQSIKQNSNDIEILSQAMTLLNESKLDKVELQENVLKFYAKEVEKFSITIPTGSGGSGIPGQDGRDGREIELRKGETHIEWNYVGEDNWKQLVSLEELKGNDGVTPNITIGNVETLSPGSQATVTRRGTTEAPIFDFGIPQGQPGGGEGGPVDLSAYQTKRDEKLTTTEKEIVAAINEVASYTSQKYDNVVLEGQDLKFYIGSKLTKTITLPTTSVGGSAEAIYKTIDKTSNTFSNLVSGFSKDIVIHGKSIVEDGKIKSVGDNGLSFKNKNNILDLNLGLRSISDEIYDVYDNGNLSLKCYQLNLNETLTWSRFNTSGNISMYLCSIPFAPAYTTCLIEGFEFGGFAPSGGGGLNTDSKGQGLYLFTNTAYVKINPSLLENDTVEGFLKYIASNPIKVIYELKTPTTIKMDIKNLQIEKGNNDIVISDPLCDFWQMKIPTNNISSLETVLENSNNHSEELFAIPQLREHPNVNNPVLSKEDVTDRTGVTGVADPFVVKEKGIYHMFFEVLSGTNPETQTRADEIGHAYSYDGLKWHYTQIVLSKDEFGHRSAYPYVFKANGEYYMIPDSTDNIYVYKSINFPYKWEKVSQIKTGKNADTNVFKFNGVWWMTSGTASDGIYLYYNIDNDFTTTNWIQHPRKLMNNDSFEGGKRGAGNIIVTEKAIYMPVQKTPTDTKRYGEYTDLYVITDLTFDDYKLKKVGKYVTPSKKIGSWNETGTHHISYCGNGKDKLFVSDGLKLPDEYSIGILIDDTGLEISSSTNSTTAEIPKNIWTKVNLDKIKYDTCYFNNRTDNVLTIIKSGYYLVNAKINLDCRIKLKLDESTIFEAMENNFTRMLYLKEGKISLEVISSIDTTLNVNENNYIEILKL